MLVSPAFGHATRVTPDELIDHRAQSVGRAIRSTPVTLETLDQLSRKTFGNAPARTRTWDPRLRRRFRGNRRQPSTLIQSLVVTGFYPIPSKFRSTASDQSTEGLLAQILTQVALGD